MPPRALHPSGIILVDKPAGPTSFAIVAATRRRTKARTGHAGTLDPFATGLLLLLSGAATRLQSRFVGLSKRYSTAIDLSARTSTGDLEGERIDDHDPPAAAELDAALTGLRGAVDLPIPAVSAVKIEGERAYALHRRGVAVEMPVRTMLVHELTLDGYEDGVAHSTCSCRRGRTFARSRTRSAGTASRSVAPRSARSASRRPIRSD